MTGFRHSSFRHKCKNDGCYIDQLPSWQYVDECFPRGIIPTDIDGMVEVNGSFLFIEEKGAGAGLKDGQGPALKALSRLDGVTVALIRPGDKSEMQLNVLSDGVGTYFQDVTVEEYRTFLREWGIAADSRSPSRPVLRSDLEERIVQLQAQVDYLKYEILATEKKQKGESA